MSGSLVCPTMADCFQPSSSLRALQQNGEQRDKLMGGLDLVHHDRLEPLMMISCFYQTATHNPTVTNLTDGLKYPQKTTCHVVLTLRMERIQPSWKDKWNSSSILNNKDLSGMNYLTKCVIVEDTILFYLFNGLDCFFSAFFQTWANVFFLSCFPSSHNLVSDAWIILVWQITLLLSHSRLLSQTGSNIPITPLPSQWYSPPKFSLMDLQYGR